MGQASASVQFEEAARAYLTGGKVVLAPEFTFTYHGKSGEPPT